MDKVKKVANWLGEFWATFFFVGRCPKAPGTMGSLAALPLAWYLWAYLPAVWVWVGIALIFVSGTLAAGVVFRRTGVSDHQSIVIDEVLGIMVTTSVAMPGNYWHFALAFVLFRIFDIWKPWPVRYFDQNWHTPLGTMMDDFVASLMSTGLLWSIIHYRFYISVFQKLFLPLSESGSIEMAH